MSPLMASAHFAAYIWFTHQPENAGKGTDEAMRFAEEEWPAFLKLANPGLGRLLLKLAEAPARRRPKHHTAPVLVGHAPAALDAGAPPWTGARRVTINQPFSRN